MLNYIENLNDCGFNFENTKRNEMMLQKENVDKKAFENKKTGTTLCGFVLNNAVILASDTRATGGQVVMEKNINKFHYIAPNIWSCGAGTAADNDYVLEKLSCELELLRLNTGRQSRVKTLITKLSNHLFRYMGHLGVYQIVGGYDVEGPHLYETTSSGFYCKKNRITSGSGSLNAMSVLEHNHRLDMSIEEGVQLAIKSISAGIIYDLGSGSNVNVIVLTKDNYDLRINIKLVGKREDNSKLKYMQKNIPILKRMTLKFDKEEYKEEN